jgi:hypothetical protein
VIFFGLLLKSNFNKKRREKMKRSIIAVFIVLMIGLGVSQTAHADRRGYVWTYEYMTMLKGMFELEYYLTEQQPNIDKSKPNTWKHYVELEYGITSHWDISVYQVFKQANTENNSSFEYDGFKLRTRYRIAEKDQLPLDTLLYFEYIRNDDFKKPNVLEGKVILAKDVGKLNIAYNQILKQELESNGKTEHEYAAGVNYALTPQFKIGVETKGNYTDEKYYIGPTMSWGQGKFWAALGAAAGLSEKSDDLQMRLIVGILF